MFKDSKSNLNKKSLARLEENYLNSNYIDHIESKLRTDLYQPLERGVRTN